LIDLNYIECVVLMSWINFMLCPCLIILVDELFDDEYKSDVESRWNEFSVCNIYMMTADTKILVGLE
jgi:hypothetical protein